MLQRTKYSIGVIVVILLGLGLWYGLDRRAQSVELVENKVKIGVILPLTGDLAVTGEKIYQGFQLAQATLPKNIEFVVEDSHSKPTDAVTAASKLLNVDGVSVIMGTYNPDETLAVAPLAREKGVPVFSFSFCSDSFQKEENVFCAYPNANEQLKTVIPTIQKNNVKTIALLNSNSDFGMSSRDGMKRLASEGGYQIVFDELVSPNQKEFRTVLAKLLATKPEGVFMAADSPTQALTMAKELHEFGYQGMRITFIDVDNKNLEAFGSTVEGTLAPGIAPSQFSSAFAQAYQEKFHKDPDYTSALGYDVSRLLSGTLASHDWSANDLKQNVVNQNYLDPAIANFHFLSDRTVVYQLELQMVKNGKYVRAE
ncbi:amino acid ABC transporter substrate-binding protein [Candidatus Uhrbacteria bacterium]|nr:amino acid ABC transporter substrate-binding protein [Candidatus Uhrbacteria bacterium]